MSARQIDSKALAKRSGLSLRKITQLRAGQPASRSTIDAAMPHLRLTFRQITGQEPAPEDKASRDESVEIELLPGGRTSVTMKFDRPKDKGDLRKTGLRMLASVAGFLGFDDGYNPDDTDVTSSSINVSVPLTQRDIIRLLTAYLHGFLKDQRIASITIGEPGSLIAVIKAPPDAPPSLEFSLSADAISDPHWHTLAKAILEIGAGISSLPIASAKFDSAYLALDDITQRLSQFSTVLHRSSSPNAPQKPSRGRLAGEPSKSRKRNPGTSKQGAKSARGAKKPPKS
jgi:hypothetical protein